MNEETLSDLLAFIQGKEKFKYIRLGIISNPTFEDENNKNIHQSCLELEKRGLIYRHLDEPGHVFWRPTPKSEEEEHAEDI